MSNIMLNSELSVVKLGRKPIQVDCQRYNNISCWQVVNNITADSLSNFIEKGFSVCGAVKNNGVGENNIVEVGAVFLDLDNNVNIQRVLDDPFVKKYAAVIHHTASSKPENPRLRVCFIYDTPVSYEASQKAIISLHLHYGVSTEGIDVDKSGVNPGRLFFGSRKGSVIWKRENRLPVDYGQELDTDVVSEFDNTVAIVRDDTNALSRIWGILSEDLANIEDDYILTNFFPDIVEIEPIKPQRDNILRQYRGNPTYRHSTSGRSFDIFFNKDGSITWCDKSDPENSSGHFVDYYYRYLQNDGSGLAPGIIEGDRQTFWDTLKKVYKLCDVTFHEAKYYFHKHNVTLDASDFIDLKGKAPSIIYNKLAEMFLETHYAFSSDVDKCIYIYNGAYYQSYSPSSFRTFITKWLKLIVFKDIEVLYYDLVSPGRFNHIISALNNNMENHMRYVSPDVGYINFENGLFDIVKKELIPHTPDVITYGTNGHIYQPGMGALEEFTYLLDKLIGDPGNVRDFIRWVVCAVCNQGGRTRRLLAAYGDSGSGKTSVTDAIVNMLQSDREGTSTGLATPFASVLGDTSNYGTASLLGKRLVCFTELGNFRMSKSEIGKLKDMVGQDEFTIHFNSKWGSAGYIKQSIATMLTCENIPDLPISDAGLYRRIFWVRFTKCEDDLEYYFNCLQNPAWLSKLLSDLINQDHEKFLEYFKSDKFSAKVEKMSHHIAVNDDYCDALSALVDFTDDSKDYVKFPVLLQHVKLHFVANDCSSKINRRGFSASIKRAMNILFGVHETEAYDQNNKKFKKIKLKVSI